MRSDSGITWPLLIGQEFYVIKYSNGSWRAFHYYYEMKDKAENTEEDLNPKATLTDLRDTFCIYKSIAPNVGWNNFIDSIKKCGILDLPSQNELKGYRSRVADGNFFWLEYATKEN